MSDDNHTPQGASDGLHETAPTQGLQVGNLTARIEERKQARRMMRETTVNDIPYYLMEKSWWERRSKVLKNRLKEARDE